MKSRTLRQPWTRRRFLMAAGVPVLASSSESARRSSLRAVQREMPLRERAARMFMFPISGPVLTADEAAWLRELKPGGVILVQNNFGTPDEVRALVADIHATNPALPPLVALDQEGGIVSRIADDPAPDAATLGTYPLEEVAALAGARADVLAGYGFDLNFAPVADVAFAPDSFMTGRAFGGDPQQVADDVVAYLDGVAESGVLHCAKHFPGHGRVAVDSHEELPVLQVDAAIWEDSDALPFAAAIAAGVPSIMLGHLVMPAWDDLPASLSPAAVRMLRDPFGFAGVVTTDDLFMGALAQWQPLQIVDLAVAAGVDLLLYVGLPDSPDVLVDHVVGLVESGAIPSARIDESVARLIALRP